jgi:hypothetical protein
MMNGAVACLLPVVVTFDDDMSNDEPMTVVIHLFPILSSIFQCSYYL